MKTLSPIALGLALAFPFAAQAQSPGELKAEIEMLKAQIAELKAMVVKQAAAPAAAVPPTLAADVAKLKVKVEAIEDGQIDSGFGGLKFSGFLDPTYVYNERADRGDFIFLNDSGGPTNDLAADSWGYMNPNFGGVTILLEKQIDTDLAATVKLRPYKSPNNGWVEEAFMSIGIGEGRTVVVGKRNSFNGYESVDAAAGKNVTHNLLYDFGGPLEMTGAGVDFNALGMDWKTTIGNMNSQRDLKGAESRGFHWRGDYEVSEFFGVGVSGMHGKLDGQGYNYVGLDTWYTKGEWNINTQLEVGQHKHMAFNGGKASHVGASVLASYMLGEGWEAVARVDYLDDHKNGGWRGYVEETGGGECLGLADFEADPSGATAAAACGDHRNGFGPQLGFDTASGLWGITNSSRGAKRSAITLGMNYQLHENALLKLEVRFDRADIYAFYDFESGNFKKSNTLFAAQTVIKF